MLGAWLFAVGCTDASLRGSESPPPEPPDNELRVRGDLCIEPTTEVDFPVKVLFLLDQSYSQQFTDPNKRRHEAVRKAVQQLQDQRNVEVAFVGFSAQTNVANPDNPFRADLNTFQDFQRNDDALGPATDYQGALATARRIIDRDLREMDEADRPRTRYVVNFVTDGNPEPTCQQGCEDGVVTCSDGQDNDGDDRVDGEDPDCQREELDPAGCTEDNPCVGRCNSKMQVRDGYYTDFQLCGAYNQPRQIRRRVEDLMELGEIYDVGGITTNAILLFTTDEIPDVLDYDREEARELLKGVAEVGDGTFRDVNVGGDRTDFLNFKIESIDIEHKLRELVARNHNLRAGREGAWRVDSDGDGLSDADEQERGLDPRKVDTDGDGFRDYFEVQMSDQGFDPSDPKRPASSCGEVADSGKQDRDGDGLRDCEEVILELDPLKPDTDLDGLPDGLEFEAGTDPARADANVDLDFDGVSNREEIRSGRRPDEPDQEGGRRISYEITDRGLETSELVGEPDDRQKRCYDYDIQRIPLGTPSVKRNRGRNRIYLRATQRPTQTKALAGKLRTACVEAIYDEEGIKKPEDGVIDLRAEAIEQTRRRLETELKRVRRCPQIDLREPRRGQLEQVAEQCLGPKVQVGDRLLRGGELRRLIRQYLADNLAVKMPRSYSDLFAVDGQFDPDRHCYRPWEIELFARFLDRVESRCRACARQSEKQAGGEGE
jgi:hypothetical protein